MTRLKLSNFLRTFVSQLRNLNHQIMSHSNYCLSERTMNNKLLIILVLAALSCSVIADVQGGLPDGFYDIQLFGDSADCTSTPTSFRYKPLDVCSLDPDSPESYETTTCSAKGFDTQSYCSKGCNECSGSFSGPIGCLSFSRLFSVLRTCGPAPKILYGHTWVLKYKSASENCTDSVLESGNIVNSCYPTELTSAVKHECTSTTRTETRFDKCNVFTCNKCQYESKTSENDIGKCNNSKDCAYCKPFHFNEEPQPTNTMGNITKLETTPAVGLESDSHPKTNPRQELTSKLIDWKCIHKNDTTPYDHSYNIKAFAEDHKIYFFNGWTTTSTTGVKEFSQSKLFIYDVRTKLFDVFKIEERIEKLSWVHKVDTKVYLIMDGCFYIYDTEIKKITKEDRILPSRSCDVVYYNQKIYFFNFGGEIATDLLIYDTKEGSWTSDHFKFPTPANNSKRPKPFLVMIENELHGFAGNIVSIQYSNQVFKFNFETKEWTLLETKGDTPVSLSGHGLSSLNIQGVPHLVSLWGYGGSYKNVLQILNLKTLEWEVTQIPFQYRTSTCLVNVDNVLYALGGCSRDDAGRFIFYNDIHTVRPKDKSLKSLCLDVVRAHQDKYEDALLNQLPSELKDLL